MESTSVSSENRLQEYSSPELEPNPLSTNSRTMAEMLTLTVKENADSIALKYHADDAWHDLTYAQFGETIEQIAKGLIASGVERGEAVAILSNTRCEWTCADFGTLCIGGVVAPVYPSNSPEECEYVINHSQSKVVFVEDAQQLEKLGQVRDQLNGVELIVVFDPADADIGDAISLEELKQRGQDVGDDTYDARVAAVEPSDLCTIIYTSGTTGPPKGCMLTHENFRNTTTMGAAVISDLNSEEGEVVYLFLPLAHAFALLTQFIVLDLGGTLAYWRRDPQLIIPDLMEVKPESLPSVPRIFEKIYALANTVADQKPPEERAQFKQAIELGLKVREMQDAGQEVPAEMQAIFEQADEAVYANVRNLFGGRVKRAVTGAAPIAKEILEFFYACGIPVYEGYGMTETATLASANNAALGHRFGSIGRPVSGVTVRIAEDGEILLKGKNIFQGYYKDEAATAETIDADGWLHTGDLGYIDGDGFIFIDGRKKDIIITAGGKNLTPANWENAMKQSRWVSQAVMYGDRRPFPSAIVTIDPEEAAALRAELGLPEDATLHDNAKVIELIESINAEVNKKFAQVEQVKKIAILDHDLSIETGELTPSLKVKRNIVHERYADVYDGLYDS
jgi:long-chain acyl-CoA synthetase